MRKEAVQLYDAIANGQGRFRTEEDVRVYCEAVFSNFFKGIGVPYDARYEVKIEKGAVDALYNNLCLEYKKPGLLSRSFDLFVSQKEKYIAGLAKKYHTQENQIICVLLDGKQIGFFRKTADGEVVKQGPYDLSPVVLDYFIHLVRSFQRKALISENLIIDLGERSQTASLIVKTLWEAFKGTSDVRTQMFYREWARMFGQVSDFGAGKDSVVKEASNYGISLNEDAVSEFIFVLHTAYAIYIKLIALMIMRSFEGQSDVPFPEAMQENSVRMFAERLETGSEFVSLGIRNFLEGDFFCWYTKAWNEALEKAFLRLFSVLNQYEPSSVSLKPEVISDLLKELYQGLLSKPMRHSLGEYYTPDWLAEFTIKEMLEKYPQALDFFSIYKDELQQRSSLKRYLAEAPFYSCWNVGSYTFAPYKVCWSEISDKFKACILSTADGRIVVPDHKIYFIPLESKQEALYLCAFLNAYAVEDFILGYAESTQIGSHITDYLHIPAFNPRDTRHKRLAQMSADVMQGKTSAEEARREADRLIHRIFNTPHV